MAKKVATLLTTGIVLVLLAGCRSATHYSSADDLDLIARSISEKVASESSKSTDRDYVLAEFPKLSKKWEDEAVSVLTSESRFRFEMARKIYSKLQQLNQQIEGSGIYSQLINYRDYTAQINELQTTEARYLLEEARNELSQDTRPAARSAYFKLLTARELDGENQDILDNLSIARERASTLVSYQLYLDNSFGIDLSEIGQGLDFYLAEMAVLGPFTSCRKYSFENPGEKGDHLLEIRITRFETGDVIRTDYTQDVAGEDSPFQIIEETMDMVLTLETTITDLGINQVLDRSSVKVERKLENLLGNFEGDTTRLSSEQRDILMSSSLTDDLNGVIRKLSPQLTQLLVDEISDFYQSY